MNANTGLRKEYILISVLRSKGYFGDRARGHTHYFALVCLQSVDGYGCGKDINRCHAGPLNP